MLIFSNDKSISISYMFKSEIITASIFNTGSVKRKLSYQM